MLHYFATSDLIHVYNIYIYIYIPISVRSTPDPVTVANKGLQGFPTRNIILLVATVTGWPINPTCKCVNIYIYIYPIKN